MPETTILLAITIIPLRQAWTAVSVKTLFTTLIRLMAVPLGEPGTLNLPVLSLPTV